ncbi:MAG: tRNA pseudouridine(38-40) synthase TruA [Planctomycetota bacterium]
MPTWKLTLAYEGTGFCGWQRQPQQRTVQGALEAAWREVTDEQPQVTAASRTDSGVHAEGQVVALVTEASLDAADVRGALNAKLPEDAAVVAVEAAPDNFHATHDSIGKRYRYRVYNARVRPVAERRFVWHVPQPLDEAAMHRAGQALVGRHDFASFESAGSERESTVRTIRAVEVTRSGEEVSIEVEGDGFLYNMVRIIAGTLVEAGRGLREESWVAEALAACDRRAAGQTAPPQGLCLLRVFY